MIIEFAGCSGAGKTTLAVGVAQRLRAGGRDIRDHCSVDSSRLVSLSNALRTPFLLLPILLDWRTCYPCLHYGWRTMRGRAPSAFWRAARWYALIRLAGQDALRRRVRRNAVLIVDEGLTGTVSLALGGPVLPSRADIELFLSALPLPDLIVWVDAPLESVVGRTLSRPNPPRELRGLDREQIRTRLMNVHAVFRVMAGFPRVAGRLVQAWNPTAPLADREIEMDRIADALRKRLDGSPAASTLQGE